MSPPSFIHPRPRRRVRPLKDSNKEEEIKEMVGAPCTYYFSQCKKIRFSIDECIPEELLFEILLRLPPQDIYYASRLVCRKWYHMVRTKSFIQKHLEHASYGLLYRDESGDAVFISDRQVGGGIDTYKLHDISRDTVWSSCNGLMLEYEMSFHNRNSFYYVTNISTDQAFRLPPFPYRLHCFGLSGIGYDAASMTYKVVAPYYDEGFGCAILTVGVDKSWRRVRIDHLSFVGKETILSVPIITEGFVHWSKQRNTKVVTLNLETEIIEETPPPIHEVVLPQENIKCVCLSTGRSLSLFLCHRKLVWDVFEMKPEIGEWRKLPKICLKGQKGRIERLGFKLDDVDIKPCGWLKYPEVLALRIQSYFIIFYNLITGEIGAEKLSIFKHFLPVTLHKNSLVWLGIP